MIVNGILGIVILIILVCALIDTLINPNPTHMNKLGTVTGKHLNDIINIIGNPQSSSINNNNTITYQWITPGIHLVLLFDSNNVCLGVTHQYVAYRG